MVWQAFNRGMLLAVVLAAATAVADDPAPPLRLSYDAGGAPLIITRDAAGVMQFDGLPYPGLVLYVPATGVVYYQHPDEAVWLAIPPEALSDYAAPAQVVAGAPWQPFLDAPTRRWQVKAAGMVCDNWFASPKAAAISGLDAAGLMRVLAAMQWLHAGSIATPCERLGVRAADAAKVGLPIHLNAPSGVWQLRELVQDFTVAAIALPEIPVPVDDNARLRILLYQLPPERRVEVLAKVRNLPVAAQLEQVQRLLVGEGDGPDAASQP